jgi:YidC/Oxa1 family membrane protein insertase
LLAVLKLIQRLTHNWGVAIIVLTLAIRALLFPLNRRAQTAMARYQTKMKRVQPRLEELKKKYEKDPQALRREQARIMQEEKAFPPLGGCLPIFIQLPIFFGLYSALRTSFDLRQARFFGWIDDLSRPDRMFELGFELPLIGTIEHFNLLPLLMMVLWILQQRTMPKPTDEQQARVQRIMMFMPIVMGVFLYNYAAGLSLYMITTAAMSILEHGFIKKRWPVKENELDKPKKGCGPFSGILQNLAEKHAEQMKRLESGRTPSPTRKR